MKRVLIAVMIVIAVCAAVYAQSASVAAQLQERVCKIVFHITLTVKGTKFSGDWQGSGTIISRQDGRERILTCGHVIPTMGALLDEVGRFDAVTRKMEIIYPDGSSVTRRINKVDIDMCVNYDAAFITFNHNKGDLAPVVVNQQNPYYRQDVYNLACPYGLDFIFDIAYVAKPSFDMAGFKGFITTGNGAPGISGSGAFFYDGTQIIFAGVNMGGWGNNLVFVESAQDILNDSVFRLTTRI